MDKFYHIVTYGCQMNVHESEKIAGILSGMGYSECGEPEKADIIVFNTCCIRENAENHAYGNIGMLKKLKRDKKDMIIAVGGCLPQQMNKAENLHEKFPYVDIIFGTHNLHDLKGLIEKKLAQKKTVISVPEDDGEICEDDKPLRTSFPNAWVNIMYGCNNFCSYCIVPYVRGRERSRKSQNIIEEVQLLVAEGYKEITLLGQNVNSYSDDLTFPRLLDKIASIDGKFRLRFMTSHPKDFSRELIEVMARHPKICNCLHLPVQSGSNAVLKAMNRHYTAEEYLAKVRALREVIPDCAITTDLIVGFPGETDEDFAATLALVKEVNFSSAFTFVYSRREGTKAAEMSGQVDEEVSKTRIMQLIELVNAQTRALSQTYIGKTVEILCEDYDAKKDLYMGRDEYGRMGYFECPENVIGKFVNVRIEHANGVSLTGKLVD